MELAGPSHILGLASDLDFPAEPPESPHPEENKPDSLYVKLEPADGDLVTGDPLLQDQAMTPSRLQEEAGSALACEMPCHSVTAECISGPEGVKVEPNVREFEDQWNIDPAGEVEDSSEVHCEMEFDVDPEEESQGTGSHLDSKEEIEEDAEYSKEENKGPKQKERQNVENGTELLQGDTCSGERRYTCHECGKSYLKRNILVVHCRTHTGDRPYSCKQCGKSFAEKGRLTVHCRMHTGERPYSCDLCGKSFTQKGSLTVHCRIHTGERPYSCGKCGRGFIRKTELLVHCYKHTTKRPCCCEQC